VAIQVCMNWQRSLAQRQARWRAFWADYNTSCVLAVPVVSTLVRYSQDIHTFSKRLDLMSETVPTMSRPELFLSVSNSRC